MGTPEFAVPALDILYREGYEIAAVVTATDKWGGRGKKQLIRSAVAHRAVELGLPLLQPELLKSPAFLDQLKSYQADIQIVVAFRMLPEVVWAMPPLGTFNLHGSLLPQYRGAAPINWAVIHGEKETGLTTFRIQQEIDTGDLMFQARLPIGEDETAGELHDRMMLLGAELVLKTVRAIESGDYLLQKQDDSRASKAPKLFHDTCAIDFAQSTEKVHNFIRGLSPHPSAWTLLDGQAFKIFRSAKRLEAHDLHPGFLRTDHKNYIQIATTDGFIEVLELQLQGKKRMGVKDFLNGYSILAQKVGQ